MNQISTVIFFALVAAILYVLVRPGSPGPAAVIVMGEAVAAVVGTATGFTQRGA